MAFGFTVSLTLLILLLLLHTFTGGHKQLVVGISIISQGVSSINFCILHDYNVNVQISVSIKLYWVL